MAARTRGVEQRDLARLLLVMICTLPASGADRAEKAALPDRRRMPGPLPNQTVYMYAKERCRVNTRFAPAPDHRSGAFPA